MCIRDSHIVKGGRVRRYRTASDGRSLTTAILGPGSPGGLLDLST